MTCMRFRRLVRPRRQPPGSRLLASRSSSIPAVPVVAAGSAWPRANLAGGDSASTPSTLSTATPVVVKGLMDAWPAKRWAIASLAARAEALSSEEGGRGPLVVPVEFGGHYMDPEMQTLHVDAADLFAFLGKSGEGEQEEVGHLYLAQHDYSEMEPLLSSADAPVPYDLIERLGVREEGGARRCSGVQGGGASVGSSESGARLTTRERGGDVGAEGCGVVGDGGPRGTYEKTNFWCGTRGVISPCHQDPFYNLLCQVHGRKIVRLYPPSVGTSLLYPATGTVQKNTSTVHNLEDVDLERYVGNERRGGH